jgi:hypothetical protein
LKSEIQAINRKLDQILAVLNDATIEAPEESESEPEIESESEDIE